MSFGNTFEDDILKLIFNAMAIADLAQNDGSSPATDIYVSLHTADPGEGGTQATNETTYTGYARVAVARTSGGWTVVSGAVTNAAEVLFGACTSGTPTITHVGVGTNVGNYLIASGPLSASLAVSPGITPRFAAGELDLTLD